MFSPSDSNPWVGAAPRRRIELGARPGTLLGFPAAGLADLRGPPCAVPAPIRDLAAGRAGVLVSPPAPAAALRAAARRGLERWGRVCGRLTSTSRSCWELLDRELPLASLIQSTIALGPVGGGSAGRLNLDGRGVSMGRGSCVYIVTLGRLRPYVGRSDCTQPESGRAQVDAPGLSIDGRNGNTCQ